MRIIFFLYRSFKILLLSTVALAAFLFSFNRARRARILRWYFQHCGTAFIKIGQLMSMRYDLLPREYCNELLQLLDNLPALPFQKIKPIMERELGAKLEDIFESVNQQALGIASVAQVHQGRLTTGESVVIKVLKPGVIYQFNIDFFYLRIFSFLVDLLGLFKNISVGDLIAELTKLTREEFDFRREAANLCEMHKNMNEDEVAHYAPEVFLDYCGPGLITMGLIEGVSVKDIILALERNDRNLLSGLEAGGISIQRTARIIVRSLLEQSVRHRLYHVDPHAGNLIVMKDGTLGWIDFGMVGWLDEKLWAGQYKMRKAIVKGNVYEAYLSFLETLEPLPRKDLSYFEAASKECFRDWIAASKRTGSKLVEKSSGYFFTRLLLLIRSEGLSLPTNLVRLYRAIIIADMVSLKLYPGLDWVEVMAEFVQDEEQRLFKDKLEKSFSVKNLVSSINLVLATPEIVGKVYSWFEKDLPGFKREFAFEANRALQSVKWVLKFLKISVLIFLVLSMIRPIPGSQRFFGDRLENFLGRPFTLAPGVVFFIGIGVLLFISKIIRFLEKSA